MELTYNDFSVSFGECCICTTMDRNLAKLPLFWAPIGAPSGYLLGYFFSTNCNQFKRAPLYIPPVTTHLGNAKWVLSFLLSTNLPFQNSETKVAEWWDNATYFKLN